MTTVIMLVSRFNREMTENQCFVQVGHDRIEKILTTSQYQSLRERWSIDLSEFSRMEEVEAGASSGSADESAAAATAVTTAASTTAMSAAAAEEIANQRRLPKKRLLLKSFHHLEESATAESAAEAVTAAAAEHRASVDKGRNNDDGYYKTHVLTHITSPPPGPATVPHVSNDDLIGLTFPLQSLKKSSSA